MVYHGLLGSASPVLTATSFVNGRWQFLTPTESTPLDRSPKNVLLVITSATPIRMCQIWCKSVLGQYGGLLSKWVKYNGNFIYLFIYLYLFSSTHLQVTPADGISRLMAQTTRIRARMCLLGVSLTLLPILGVKYSPKNPILGA